MSYVDRRVPADAGSAMETEAAERYQKAHRQIIESLEASGHAPYVWIEIQHGYAGDPFTRVHMTCANCDQKWRGRIVNLVVGLSPLRPCRHA